MKGTTRQTQLSPTRSEKRSVATPILALLLGLGLLGCQPKPETVAPEVRAADPVVAAEPTAGERLDGAIAEAERKTEQVGAALAQGADEAGMAITDAGITAAINAKLATDPDLSALRINVDTQAGRVALSGDAPNQASRERAGELVRSVDGVKEVDNQLTIQSKG